MRKDPNLIAPKLEEALILAEIGSQGAAAIALARRYARLLDEAAPAAKYRDALGIMGRALEHYRESEPWAAAEARRIDAARATIDTALAEHSVASDLGPKLLATLTALGLVLAAAATPGKAKPNDQPTGTTPEDELASLRAARIGRAQAVDTAAPGADA